MFMLLAMLAMVSQNIRFAGIMQDRTLAAIAADNRMVEALSLPDTFKLGARDGDIEVAGRTMRYQQVTTETGVNGVIRIDISIFAEIASRFWHAPPACGARNEPRRAKRHDPA